MDRYKDYALEDFVLDAEFQNWVRYKSVASTAFWRSYQERNPAQAQDIRQAGALLESVYRHYSSHLSDSDIDHEIHQLLSKIHADKSKGTVIQSENIQIPWQKKVFGKTAFLAAAVVILALGLGWLYQSGLNTSAHDYSHLTKDRLLVEVVNKSAANKLVILPDSSRIILKPDSRVSYPETFLTEQREVYLSGEAFFKVTKDPKRPFLVFANDLVTKVLGTSFTINARNKTQKTTVEVSEGKVSVFRQRDFLQTRSQKVLQSKGVVLTSNQKLVFEEKSANMLKTLRDEPEVIVSGEKPKLFDFVNTPASVVLDDLKEAYQVDIIFDKELLNDCPVTATLMRQSLFEKLDIVCEVIEAHYEMLDGRIVVYSKGCKN